MKYEGFRRRIHGAEASPVRKRRRQGLNRLYYAPKSDVLEGIYILYSFAVQLQFASCDQKRRCVTIPSCFLCVSALISSTFPCNLFSFQPHCVFLTTSPTCMQYGQLITYILQLAEHQVRFEIRSNCILLRSKHHAQ